MEKYLDLTQNKEYSKLKEPAKIIKERRNSNISNRNSIWHRNKWSKYKGS